MLYSRNKNDICYYNHRYTLLCLQTNYQMGGRQTKNTRRIISERFPTTCNNYHEIFLGGGSVLLSLLERIHTGNIRVRGHIYAYDKNSVLIHMYKNIQQNHGLLIEYKSNLFNTYNAIDTLNGERNPTTEETSINSKESYYYWIRKKYNTMTDEAKHSCEGRLYSYFSTKRVFVDFIAWDQMDLTFLFYNYNKPNVSNDHIVKLSQTIQNVVFKCRDFTESLGTVQQGDFVYLDPPYVPLSKTSFVGYLSGGFKNDEHETLFGLIRNLREKNLILDEQLTYRTRHKYISRL